MLNLEDTVTLLQGPDFTIHPDKLQLVATQKLTEKVESISRTLKLTQHKQKKTFTLRSKIIKSGVQSVKKIASFLGNTVASFEAVPLGPLYYRKFQC